MMMSKFGKVNDKICYCRILWDLVLVNIPGGTRYPYIRAGLSLRDVSGTLNRDTILL